MEESRAISRPHASVKAPNSALKMDTPAGIYCLQRQHNYLSSSSSSAAERRRKEKVKQPARRGARVPPRWDVPEMPRARRGQRLL